MVILRISVASSHLNGIVFALQCLVSPLMQQIFDGLFNAKCGLVSSCVHNILPKIFFSITGVVNLDFFRGVYPSFCLHPQLNIIHILFLDYIVALYPFILIFITYVCLGTPVPRQKSKGSSNTILIVLEKRGLMKQNGVIGIIIKLLDCC